MPNKTRAIIPGGTFFVTVTRLARRRALLMEHINILGHAFRQVQSRRPFTVDSIAVLSDQRRTGHLAATGACNPG